MWCPRKDSDVISGPAIHFGWTWPHSVNPTCFCVMWMITAFYRWHHNTETMFSWRSYLLASPMSILTTSPLLRNTQLSATKERLLSLAPTHSPPTIKNTRNWFSRWFKALMVSCSFSKKHRRSQHCFPRYTLTPWSIPQECSVKVIAVKNEGHVFYGASFCNKLYRTHLAQKTANRTDYVKSKQI